MKVRVLFQIFCLFCYSYGMTQNSSFTQRVLSTESTSSSFRDYTLSINDKIGDKSIPNTIYDEKQYYALIIGNEEYEDPDVRDLMFPIGNAKDLAKVLVTQYTFEEENLVILLNATKKEIFEELEKLARVINAQDVASNLLIFYAGHGTFDGTIGYWLTSEVDLEDKSTYLANSALIDYFKKIRSQHTLLITDACFSGSIFNTRDVEDASIPIEELYTKKSRKAMTSGALESVPDNSAFVTQLINELQNNRNKYIYAQKIFTDFYENVIYNSVKQQIPQYGIIALTDHEGGDFIFIKRK